jgi:hypothetical protein
VTDGTYQSPGIAPPGWRQQKLRDNGDSTASPYSYPRYLDANSALIADTITVTSNKWYGLIDLSAAGGTMGAFLNFFRLEIDKTAAVRGSVTAYVVTAITTLSASLTPVGRASLSQNDSTSFEQGVLLAPSSMRADVVAGNTPFIQCQTSLKLTGVVAVNTTTPLANGIIYTPAVGDIVVNAITTNNGSFTFLASAIYGVN